MKKIISGSLITSAMFLAACGGGEVSVAPPTEQTCEQRGDCEENETPDPNVAPATTTVYFYSPEERPYVNALMSDGENAFTRDKGVAMKAFEEDGYWYYEFNESFTEEGIESVTFTWGEESTEPLTVKEMTVNESISSPIILYTFEGPATAELGCDINAEACSTGGSDKPDNGSGTGGNTLTEATIFFKSPEGTPLVLAYDADGNYIDSREPKTMATSGMGSDWYKYTFTDLNEEIKYVEFTYSGITTDRLDVVLDAQGEAEFELKDPTLPAYDITVHLKAEGRNHKVILGNDSYTLDSDDDWHSYTFSSDELNSAGQVTLSFEMDDINSSEVSLASTNASQNEFYYAAYPVEVQEEYAYQDDSVEAELWKGSNKVDSFNLTSSKGLWSGALIVEGDSKSDGNLALTNLDISFNYTTTTGDDRFSQKADYDATQTYLLESIYTADNIEGTEHSVWIWEDQIEGSDIFNNDWNDKPSMTAKRDNGQDVNGAYVTFALTKSLSSMADWIKLTSGGEESPNVEFSELDGSTGSYVFTKLKATIDVDRTTLTVSADLEEVWKTSSGTCTSAKEDEKHEIFDTVNLYKCSGTTSPKITHIFNGYEIESVEVGTITPTILVNGEEVDYLETGMHIIGEGDWFSSNDFSVHFSCTSGDDNIHCSPENPEGESSQDFRVWVGNSRYVEGNSVDITAIVEM